MPLDGALRLFDVDEPTSDPKTNPEAVDGLVVRVLPDVSGVDKEFDYLALGDDRSRLQIGTIVKVNLNGRQVQGWVVGVGVEPAAGVNPRPIEAVVSQGPSPDVVKLAFWAARRWAGRARSILRTASPPRRIPPVATPGPAMQAPQVLDELEVMDGPNNHSVTVVRTGPNDDLSHLIRSQIGAKSALVIAPQVGVGQQIAGQLARHGLAVRSNRTDWMAAASRGGVVVGARSAIWATVADLGAIIVLDEHDEAHQEERNPTWHSRDVAIERGRTLGIPVVFASPCPSITAVVSADKMLEPSRDDEKASWPIVEVVDQRLGDPGRTGLFSHRVVDVVRGKGRVLAVLNRKGRAVMVACASCGELALTETTGHLMVETDGELVCPSTGESRPVVCVSCGGTRLKRLRLGVGRAVEELAALAGEQVGEVSADRTMERHRIVVGTEAALHRLIGVDTVVFLDFDQELSAPRYQAADQAMGMIVRAARLTGRRSAGGRIIIQTRQPDHRVITAAVRAEPKRFLAAERDMRRALNMPPFSALAELNGQGAVEFAESLSAHCDDIDVMGPRQDGRFLIRAQTADRLAEVLAVVPRPTARVRVAVDPQRA